MKKWLPVIALGLPFLGSIVPVLNILDLWKMPVGSGVRPMEAPFAFLFYGCGTPVAVIGAAIAGFSQGSTSGTSFRYKVISRVTLALACMLSFIPTVLTTYGYYWVITTRQLWLEP